MTNKTNPPTRKEKIQQELDYALKKLGEFDFVPEKDLNTADYWNGRVDAILMIMVILNKETL